MSNRKLYLLGGSLVLILLVLGFTDSKNPQDDFSETVKVSLRDIGHQLLLTHKDSTSLILPVVMLEETKYRLSFERNLSLDPNDLVLIITKSFQKAELPKYYRVEVIQCIGKEVAYSYEMSATEEKTIVPCGGRILPKSCYTIEIRFIKPTASTYNKKALVYFLLFGVLAIGGFFFYTKKSRSNLGKDSEPHTGIGSFQFYPEQNKLVKEAVEISLSKKECELLAIFVANPNQIIKRDELTKKVWEDNGVFVGRSLDTYISKLRKKLQADDTIKLTNVHGVGYKLEILETNS